MNSDTIIGLVAAVAQVAAVGVAAISIRTSYNIASSAQQHAAAAADAAAQRAEHAAIENERYTQRIADALQAIADGVPIATAVARSVRWTLLPVSRHQYQLMNVGGVDAHDVRITSDESLPVRGISKSQEIIRPSEFMLFAAARTFGTTDSTIRVQWCDDTGAEHEWRSPLPPSAN